jgi:dTDP-4-amino-4,6-dideoxygalactose transaminase
MTSRFREPLHVGRPNIGNRSRLLARVNGALDRRWLSSGGPLVREFEQRVAAITRTRHCIATCNATNGLQIAAKASGISSGDEVIIPSFTWVATPHALDWIGAVPVFCDVIEESGSADPASVERLVGPKTRGILGVHVFGRPCQVNELAEVAQRYGIPLLFDAAHAFGCTYKGRPIGGFGGAEVFSFHATKYINTFEGGAIVTNDDKLAERARAMRNLGFTDDREVVWCGTAARMNEISAAMGLTSLEAMEEIIDANRRNHILYEQSLSHIPGLKVRSEAQGERANYQYLVVEVNADEAGVSRDDLHAALHAHNVLSRKYFHPACHKVEPYRANPARHAPLPLPHTEALSERVLALPTGTAIGAPEITVICEIISDTVAAAVRGPGQAGLREQPAWGGR